MDAEIIKLTLELETEASNRTWRAKNGRATSSETKTNSYTGKKAQLGQSGKETSDDEKTRVSSKKGTGERPKITRKRSSSLDSEVLRIHVYGGVEQGELTKLRRFQSFSRKPHLGPGAAETKLEDGLLTTTLCSTEL